jgi:tellurite resistance protein
MQKDARINLLARVARTASLEDALLESEKPTSILYLAAASYGSRPSEDATVPTGFDPVAVALFEAIVEAAYVVANADGVFDADEKSTFERVVAVACGGVVSSPQIAALMSDLGDQLRADGLDRRIEAIASAITKKDHAHEVLRIAALLAQASEDISAVERGVLERLAMHCGLGPGDVDSAIAEVQGALTGAPAAKP